MTIITITLKVLDHPIFELTIDGLDLTEPEATDDPDPVVIAHDTNVINWDNQPEP